MAMKKPIFDIDEWINEHSGGAQLHTDKSASDLETAIRDYGKQCAEYAKHELLEAQTPATIACNKCNGTGHLHNSRGHYYGDCDCGSKS